MIKDQDKDWDQDTASRSSGTQNSRQPDVLSGQQVFRLGTPIEDLRIRSCATASRSSALPLRAKDVTYQQRNHRTQDQPDRPMITGQDKDQDTASRSSGTQNSGHPDVLSGQQVFRLGTPVEELRIRSCATASRSSALPPRAKDVTYQQRNHRTQDQPDRPMITGQDKGQDTASRSSGTQNFRHPDVLSGQQVFRLGTPVEVRRTENFAGRWQF